MYDGTRELYATTLHIMQTGFNVNLHRRHIRKKRASPVTTFMEKSAYLMGIVTVAVNVPQLLSI